ncbi:Fungal specific transcription factor domain [Ceratobasidium sp. AG-Ba]|nr:Fungal specific transcription factor domain [Ceratobasidium sp. AG-Ba]
MAMTQTAMSQLDYSTFQAAPQHAFAGPSRRRGRPPAERAPSDPATANGPASSTRTKNGCWSCRVRRKKCDEGSANRQGVCKQCARLEIECLGWGAKRPDWMRDKEKVAAWKANVTKSLTEKGMIRGVPRTNPVPPPFTYNPRGAHASSPSDTHDATSPISPVANYIPGAGPIPPAPKPPPAKRSSAGKNAVPVPPSVPEPTSVVPTQMVSQDSDDSDPELTFDDDFGFDNLSPELEMPSNLMLGNNAEANLGSMGINMDMPPALAGDFVDSAFGQTVGIEQVEELVTPGVSADNAHLNTNYAMDNGFISPQVVFGPIAPYVQQPDMVGYNGYDPNGDYNWSQYNNNGYGYDNAVVATTPYQQPYGSPDTPQMLRSPTTIIEQDRLRDMLILYYFKHVRQMQYVFAGEVTTNVMLHHAHMDPQGAVSLALCSLAALHDSRMRIANGIMPNDQRARMPADKYYQKALTQLQGNKQRNGRLTDADATAALHFVSFWLFAGGAGDWPVALQIAGDWYEQNNLAAHENPMRTLMEMDDSAKHASKTTMWMDIFSSISLCKSPRFLKLYRRLLQSNATLYAQPAGGPQLENVMGCSDSIMLCLAEIADLACWKATHQAAGTLSMPELVRRRGVVDSIWGNVPPMPTATITEMGVPPSLMQRPGLNTDLPNGGSRLGQPLSPPSSPPLPSAVPNGDELRRLVSDIFREAAILYLHTELSELRPGVPEIKRAVADTVNALKKLPPSEYDRSLVFPLALAGCATDDPEMRQYVQCRIQQTSSAIGNCATAGQLVEYVWQWRDTNPGRVIGWREAMAEINMTILLV